MELTEYFFVIDTDSYSGNFSRELSGHITGIDWQEPYEDSPSFGDLIEVRHVEEDDYKIDAIQTIMLFPNNFTMRGGYKHADNNSVAIFLSRRPSDEELKKLVELANDYAPDQNKYISPFKIIGFRILKREIVVTDNWEEVNISN